MITSKLTSKTQTTIPQAVRTALGVGPAMKSLMLLWKDMFC
jgi:bifunctional DNA-binding transcriptional regulator/antitoxin component of YhaV-PrlF toxin-antitoxin module